MRVSFRHRAGEFERFAPDAFASQVGKRVPLRIDDHAVADCVIIDAVVSDDGSEVEIIYLVGEVIASAAMAGLVSPVQAAPGVDVEVTLRSVEVSDAGVTLTTEWVE